MYMLKQVYDYYVKPYLGEKGQDLVEYALLLAIVVGIGYLIYQQDGLGKNIQAIFTSAGDLTSKAVKLTPATLHQ